MKSEFDRGFASGLAHASAIARITARRLYAKGSETKFEAAAEAVSELAVGFAEAIHAPLPSETPPSGVAPAAVATLAIAAPVTSADDRRLAALSRGYTGDICNDCQNMTMVRNGTCLKCDTCGSTTGCS